MASEDHFNWPMASRNDTMYLNTIKDQPAGYSKNKFYTAKSPNLDISDIDKARPHYQGYQFTQKESYANRNDDIAGSQPKRLHQPLQKVYYDLRSDDIPGTKPQSHKFVTTRQPANPLNPEYKLAQVEVRVATPPKFIRDHIDIKDIEGARPNPYTRYNIERRTNNVEDIDGAKPKKEWLPQGKPSSLDVKDINAYFEFNSKRQTNPLSPRYRVVDEDNKTFEYGQLDNKVMVRHPKEVNKVTSMDLKTDDIAGAQASSSTQYLTKIATRDGLMKTEDIPGAQKGSLKKGMTTLRQVDPLWPAYVVPGHSEPPPVYARNTKPTVTKYGNQTGSDFGVKSEVVSPPPVQAQRNTQGARSSQELEASNVKNIYPQSGGEFRKASGEAQERKSSGGRTPPPQARGSYGSALARTGEEILNVNKSNTVGGNSDYVPARMTSKEEIEAMENFRQKNVAPKSNFETKKSLNPSEVYQNNVKNFYGISNGEENRGFKQTSTAEKFDKFISK